MLLRAEEVGVVLGVSRARVHQLIRQGILPSVRLGRQVRVDQAELRKWTRSGGRSLPGGWRRTEPGEGGWYTNIVWKTCIRCGEPLATSGSANGKGPAKFHVHCRKTWQVTSQ